jgi:enoyl-[acyl-carrier protein] reductase II
MTRADALAQIQSLSERGRALLDVEHAILGGAMTWLSECKLVAAISNAGGFGVIACGSMTTDLLRAEIQATQVLTKKPFGVNLIVMHPDLDALIEVCGEEGVGCVVLAGGIPPRKAMRRVKELGATLIALTPALGIAKKLIRDGADALVIEGTEAGGHIGPVSTSVLAQEILPNVREVPVFVAGGIGRGEAILSYLEMGAAGCQLGTRFVCAEESVAHPDFKKAFFKGSARDATASVQVDPRFPVIPVRALANNATREFAETQHKVIARWRAGELDQKAAQLEIEHFWAGALRRAVIDGDVENGSLMAGQSVGMVTAEQPTADIIQSLIDQAADALIQRAAGAA